MIARTLLYRSRLLAALLSLVCSGRAAEATCTESSIASSVLTAHDSYSVAATRWDPVLQRQLTTLRSCDHPERPAITVALKGSPERKAAKTDHTAAAFSPQLVRAGERVRLWRQDEDARIELVAISNDNGRAGSVIHLHTQPLLAGTMPRELTGIVRGPGDVEITR